MTAIRRLFVIKIREHKRPTIAKNSVKLVLRQESEPIDSFLLVLAQFCLDLYRKRVLFDFAAV